MKENKEVIFIKAGGSNFSTGPGKFFDFDLALEFKKLLTPFTDKYKFIITLGGGYLARFYQEMLRKYDVPDVDIDWAGISANNHNAMMMRIALGDKAEDNLLVYEEITREDPIIINKDFLIVGGEKPGQTSDTVCARIAVRAGANRILSLKNVDGVFTEDPRKNKNAEFIEEMTWTDYGKLFDMDDLTPGGKYPVDPVAAKMAEENGISFIIVNGTNFANLKRLFNGAQFKGTIIK